MAGSEYTPDARLAELLEAWRNDICSMPIPELLSVEVAVAIVREELCRTGTAPDAAPARNSRQIS
ncbi:MAG TPA: hypothetical protein VJ870_02780 [Amycolatopsis sp.]|nr:hypothetical protein [Amycolatopsis sp.]